MFLPILIFKHVDGQICSVDPSHLKTEPDNLTFVSELARLLGWVSLVLNFTLEGFNCSSHGQI